MKYYKDFSYQDKFIHHQPYRTIKLSSLQKKNKKKALTMYESQIKVLFSSKSMLDQWIESEGSIETYYEST